MAFVMISLCIPTYNRLPYLKQCLESIFDRFGNYPYEVVLADGGSTDGTLEYLRGLDDNNVRLIEQGKLMGVVRAYNACFQKTEGDYIFVGNDDAVVAPEILVKACKFMDNEEQIGLVAPKDQETTRANVHGVTLSRIRRYWTLLSKFHIIRASILKKMNYYDESFRTYYTDDDSFLSVMKLGYTTIFTREVGHIHYRIQDENVNQARMENRDEQINKQEREYLFKKWADLELNINKYLRHSSLKKRKSVTFNFICEKMYGSEHLRPFIEKNQKISLKLYDLCLSQALIFEDKNYSNLKDFFLSQKYPDDIISSLT